MDEGLKILRFVSKRSSFAYLVSASWLACVGHNSGWAITDVDIAVYYVWYECT